MFHHRRRQEPTNCLSVFEHFVGLGLKGLNSPPILKLNFIEHFVRETAHKKFLATLTHFSPVLHFMLKQLFDFA